MIITPTFTDNFNANFGRSSGIPLPGECQKFRRKIDDLEARIKFLQEQLQNASPTQKPHILQEIGDLVSQLDPLQSQLDDCVNTSLAAAKAAWIAAAQVFATNFSDPIHVNITVDAVAGTDVFGRSYPSWLSIPYADLLARVTAKAATQNDRIAIGPGGSMTATDPTNGVGNWVLTRAQAKALGQIPDDLSEDGITVFGAGNAFTFSGPITAGTYDFQGIAAHEISEVMGRLGLSGVTVNNTANSFSLI